MRRRSVPGSAAEARLPVHLRQRVAYGREIRSAAQTVVQENGVRAEAAAWRALADEHLGEADRAFRRHVAERITRWMNQFAEPRLD
jgi:hypothetical protein